MKSEIKPIRIEPRWPSQLALLAVLLLVIESSISLTTIAVVASRAINILGS